MFARTQKTRLTRALREKVVIVLQASALALLCLFATGFLAAQPVSAAGIPPNPCETDSGVIVGDECKDPPTIPPICHWYETGSNTGVDSQERILTIKKYTWLDAATKQICGPLNVMAVGTVSSLHGVRTACVLVRIIGEYPRFLTRTGSTATDQTLVLVGPWKTKVVGEVSVRTYKDTCDSSTNLEGDVTIDP